MQIGLNKNMIELEVSKYRRLWTRNAKYHRMTGPALLTFRGIKKYYVNGVFIYAIKEDGNVTYDQYYG